LGLIITLGVLAVIFVVSLIIISVFVKYLVLDQNLHDKVSMYKFGDWYYNQLTYKEQLMYDEILNSVKKIRDKTKIMPYPYTDEEFENIITSILNDHPDVFYFLGYESKLYGNNKKSRVNLYYYANKSTVNDMVKKFDNTVIEIIKEIGDKNDFETDFDLEVAIHDYIVLRCKNVSVDSEYNYLFNTVYGALIEKTAYSSGYSSAFKYLMNKYELLCYIINGEARGIPHSWNMVYINQNFYNVDVMWNNGNISYAEDLLFHAYFNVSNAFISETHTIPQNIPIPFANTENNYYNVLELYVESLDDLKENINRIIINAAKKGRNYFELFVNFGEDVYNGEEFGSIIITSIRNINVSSEYPLFTFKEFFRIYRASETKNILTIQLYPK